MSALAMSLVESIGQCGMVKPLFRTLLGMERIGEEANGEAEQRYHGGVKQGKNDAGIHVAESVAELLPTVGQRSS